MISAFVITADDDPIILDATMRRVAWADEVILVDKGRRPATTGYPIPRIIRLNWSPTVEETRPRAVRTCSHDWIVCLDADEVLSPACEQTFRDFTLQDAADVLMVPIKHYNLGRHDPRARYWPEWRPTLARRGAIEYGPVVHAGNRIVGRVASLDADSKAHLTHLSNPDVFAYVEKANRYTTRPERTGVGVPPPGRLREWAVAALQAYEGHEGWGDDYGDAVALLRGLYDVIDGLKRWEAAQPNGREEFHRIARDA